MSDIQTPNGLEVNETLVGATDEMEVYQPASAGVRRNKRAVLNTLKTLFQTITSGTLNNIVTIDGSEVIKDSGVAIVDIGTNTTHRSSDGTDHTFIDQDVKVAASPSFVKVNTDTISEKTGSNGIDFTNEIRTQRHYKGTSVTGATIYLNITSWVPTVGDFLSITDGHLTTIGSAFKARILSIKRNGATTVKILYSRDDNVLGSNDVASVDASVWPDIELMANLSPIN